MERRFATLAGVALTTLGVVAAMTLPAMAGPNPQIAAAPPAVSGPDYSPAMLQALQRDLNLDASAARDLLQRQDRATQAELRLRKVLGDGFGGSWLVNGTLHIAATDARTAALARWSGARATVVEHSAADLDAAKAQLDEATAAVPASVPGWHVDPATNSVVVLSLPGEQAAAKKFVADSGVAADAVRYEISADAYEPFIDVIGGNAYYIGGSRCSVGFSVSGGFVTAGHCGNVGSTTSQPSGTFRGSSFPGNDYAWVEVNSGNTPRPWVNRYNGSNVTVNGSTDAPVGSAVCRSGSTTGWHCGTIQARNASVTYPQGTVNGLIRTNVCAEPGDSGGSLLAGSQAQGMTSGGSGNCSSGGTTYFQPVNEVLQRYGLTLLTGGGGTPPPTTPPPSGCSGYEYTDNDSLSSGGYDVHPNGSYYYSSSGTHRGCLLSASGTDFDLYLQRWNGSRWVTVAQSITPTNSESITYSGSSGYYRWIVHAYSGSGSYTIGITAP